MKTKCHMREVSYPPKNFVTAAHWTGQYSLSPSKSYPGNQRNNGISDFCNELCSFEGGVLFSGGDNIEYRYNSAGVGDPEKSCGATVF